ncbi:putative c6 zinc finger domain-containing protein [Phaeomoniella chlamydospora]|uniref:Putative c6 zinc finger domain-containing protein n=1 Tax=Phaeomoniella chlamydospora TaxID=158046 RepID=A0A0G2HAB5_PHACM|nr:putative c6 zinc finger domain-containing protein [Phaeomoniella chlamydospora]
MDEENKSTPIPKPLNVYTQTTLQISLWRTLPLRLKIAKLVNDFRCEPSYDETIRLGMELSKLCRTISLQFQCFGTSQASPTIFQSKLFDFLNYRFLLILHHNYAVEARSNPSFYFSRKVCLETSLALLSAFSLSQRKNGTTKTEDETDLYRLKLVGGGLFRSVPLHAFLMTSLELMSQLQENPLNYTSVGDTMARQELYKTIEEFTELTAERIKAGETNVKGHVFSSCILAQINAAQTGAPVDQTMLNVLRKSLQSSYDFLKARVGGSPSPPSSSSSLETNSTNTNTNTTNVTNDPQGQKPALQQPMLKMPNEMWSQFDDVLGWNDMVSPWIYFSAVHLSTKLTQSYHQQDNGFNLDFTESLY